MPELSGTQLDHVGLSAGDLDALAAWYGRALGLTEEARFSYAIGRRQVEGVLLASPDGWRLELQHCEGSEPGQPASVLAACCVRDLATCAFGSRTSTPPSRCSSNAARA